VKSRVDYLQMHGSYKFYCMSLKIWGRLQSRVGEDYKFYCINNIDRFLDTCGREVAMHEGYVLYIYVLMIVHMKYRRK